MKELMYDIDYPSIRETVQNCIGELQAKGNSSYLSGISTGFRPIDYLMGGFENGKVYVIGGRPCMGKEELMLSMILNIAVGRGVPVLMFSTNHMKTAYVQRLIGIHSDIPITHLSQGLSEREEWVKLDKEVEPLLDAPLYIHDNQDLKLCELNDVLRDCFREKGTRIVFIDCLQMIEFADEGEHSSERIAKVMCSLKQLAHLYDIPIVVGSMLNRSVEQREGIAGKLPQLQDLADSSYIEELADVVMMVRRPEYYHIYQDERDVDLHGKIEVHVMKNSLKPLGSILMDYDEDTGFIASNKDAKTSDAEASASEPDNKYDYSAENKAVKNLIEALDLVEKEHVLPF